MTACSSEIVEASEMRKQRRGETRCMPANRKDHCTPLGVTCRRPSLPPTPESMRVDESPLRVLLVEDSALLIQRIAELVGDLPDVVIAATADTEAEALALLAGGNIDVIILDLQLHGGSGFGILRATPPAGLAAAGHRVHELCDRGVSRHRTGARRELFPRQVTGLRTPSGRPAGAVRDAALSRYTTTGACEGNTRMHVVR